MKWQGKEISLIYVWTPYLSTSFPYQFTKRKATNLERTSRGDYLGGYKTIKDIDLPLPQPPLKLPSGTGNFNLEPQVYNLLNATHYLLNLMNTSLASDCWLYLSSGLLHYVVTQVSLLNQSMHDTTSNSISTKLKVKHMQISQRAPNCIYNSRRYYPVGELTASHCAQIQNCTTIAIRCTVDIAWWSSPETFFVCRTLAYQCLPANWKGIYISAFLTPQINIVPNNQTLLIHWPTHDQRELSNSNLYCLN
jgi:hypothetical protein